MPRQGTVVAICIAPEAGGAMRSVQEVLAITGEGLQGDRCTTREGSFNRPGGTELADHPMPVRRQVTFMNARFFRRSGFSFVDAHRNIFTLDIELMELIGLGFTVNGVVFRGVKYCAPCDRPSKLSDKPGFATAFQDCGGLIAEVVEGGWIQVGSIVVPPPRGW